jgi:hypothetical protein
MSKAKISEFRPQVKNANKHTPRGLGQLSTIVGSDGWISAITVCNDGETIDGSARLETAYEIFGDDVEPIIVRSRGDRPIIHIREDIESADDPRAIKLSVAANRIAQIDLDWDVQVLKEWDEEIDLSSMFFDGEIESMLGGEPDNDSDYAYQNKEVDTDNLDSSGTFKFSFEYAQYLQLIARFNEYKSEHGITEDNEAFAKLLDA